MLSLDAAIAEVAKLLRVAIEKLFPDSDERAKSRQEKAKENWDKLVEEEKRIQADLYERNLK